MEDTCMKCCKPMGKDMNRIALGDGTPVYIHVRCEEEYWKDRAKRDANCEGDEN